MSDTIRIREQGKSSVSYSGQRQSLSLFSKRKSGSKEASSKPKTILQQPKLSIVVPVIYEGTDVTPNCLNPYIYEGTRERQISIVDTLIKDTSMVMYRSLSRVESQKFQANILQQKQENESQAINHLSYLTTYQAPDDIMMTGISEKSTVSGDYYSFSADDDEETESVGSKIAPIPKNVSLIFSETDTVFLLDFPSCTEFKGTDDGEFAEEDNKLYEFLTKGKGRNRKVIEAGVQTVPILMKSRDTENMKIKNKHDGTFVSNWEMFDTFKEANELSDEDECDEKDHIAKNDVHRLKDDASLDSYRSSLDEKQMVRLVRNKRFLDAVLVLERLLASNCYNEEQKRFKALSDPSDVRENIEYKYNLKLLWTFFNEEVDERCVTAISFNKATDDIIAIGYGKLLFLDKNVTGIVMVWNIKNPRQPERRYRFPTPVTSLDFCNKNPNLLAVGFYNGEIKILDISNRELCVIRDDTSSSFEPVWNIIWFTQGTEENLMACYGDGQVRKYQITDSAQLKSTQIMKTAGAEGKLKGIDYLKKCEGDDIAISRYASARILVKHPVDPFTYYVGTSEGVVHKCSTNYYNQHMDLFKAHEGAINAMKYSPFANKMFVTCGDDLKVRFWIDGISQPLVTSELSITQVMDVDWNPLHPTILASIRGTEIRIWDMQRKLYAPQYSLKSPTLTRNTVCKFTPNGRCLLVGGLDGTTQVFSLENMPLTPFFSENLVKKSLKTLLVTRPDLLKKLDKIGGLNFDRRMFDKYFN